MGEKSTFQFSNTTARSINFLINTAVIVFKHFRVNNNNKKKRKIENIRKMSYQLILKKKLNCVLVLSDTLNDRRA